MTVLFLDQFSDLGGAQFCLLDLVCHMRRSGWSLHVALPAHGPLRRRVQELGATTHVLPLRSYNSGFKTPLDLCRLLTDVCGAPARIREIERAVRPDLIYVNGPRPLPLVALAGVSAPVIFHSHNTVTRTNGRLLVKWAIARSNATVIAASNFARRQWQRGVTVYGGVAGPPSESCRDRAAPYRIGLIGRIAPQKQQREFVSAAAILVRRLPGVEFILCGAPRPHDRAAKRYSDRVLRNRPENVRFWGWREPIHEVLRELDLLVMPSCDEGGFPRVLLEAFACGVPVLARNSGAVPEILSDGRNGFLLESGEPQAIAERILQIFSHPEGMSRVALNARELWRTQFTAEGFANQVMLVIRDVATRATGRPTACASGIR